MTASPLASNRNTIIGNTVLYGATAGSLFAAGQAGERFAVRNSGADAVIEGCGANACEYMTGGTVAILGSVGDNFAAGMTGGMAFVYDADESFQSHINEESVVYLRLASSHWEGVLKALIAGHTRETHSVFAERLLRDWDLEGGKFWQVCPKEMVDRIEHPLVDESVRARA